MAKMENPMKIEDVKYGLMHVTDDNNEVIEVSKEIITQIISDGASCTQYPKNVLDGAKFTPSICDSLNRVVDFKAYLKDLRDGKKPYPKSINVTIESTHDGTNLNCETYHSESMINDANSFVTPYQKPILQNHNTCSCNPLGRIQQAKSIASVICGGKQTISVVANITDEEKIPLILDGRLNTTSIGAYANEIKCGLCGANILKDGQFQFCGHWKGRSYKKDGKDTVCNWDYKGVVYNELSFVNEPADVYAQVVNIQVPDEDLSDYITNPSTGDVNNNNNNNNQQQPGTHITNNFYAGLDQILAATGLNGIVNTNNNNIPNGNVVKDNTNNSQENVELKNKIDDLTKQLQDKDTQINTLTAQNKVLNDTNVSNNEKIISLVTGSKEMIIDAIINHEIVKGITNSNTKDNRRNQLSSMSCSDLKDIYDKLDFTCIVNGGNIPKLNNPGQQNPNDPHVEDNTGNNTNNNNDNFNSESFLKTLSDDLVR